METIMYTNSKREGSSYQVDRIVFSEKMEVGQLIENQMVRYNISHIHFWFVRDNIALIEDAKAENMLIALGRYLIQNKDNDFRFQYIVEKYQETMEGIEQQENPHNFMMDLNKSVEKEEKAVKTVLEKRLTREEIIKQEIRFSHFKEFEIFIKKELRSNQDEQIIKKYLFKTQEETIAVSFFQSQQKELVHKIIDEDCNQIYNAKLHYRKISTIHPQDYQKNKKKKKETLQQPVQLYHRIILFMYSPPERIEDVRESRRKKTHKNNGPPVGAQALQAWRVKQQVQSLGKYEKQCELIKQEIENEKLIFRNKIKVIQNYIGDSINVEKLYQQEEEVCTNGLTQQMSNTLVAPTFKKPQNLLKRSSVTPAISQTITNNLEKLSKFSPVNSFVPLTEFKRLKDISQAMRNIDNTIFEQNKKIDQLKGKAKELKKLKEEVLFKNAKELNAVKREVLQLAREIQRKKEEIHEKQLNGDFETLMKYKGREPSQAAKENLQEHIKFISQHHKANETKEQQYEYQYMKEEEKSTHRSLHRRDSQNTNTATAKFREKKMQQAMATAAATTMTKFKCKDEREMGQRSSIQMKNSKMSNLLLQCENAKTTSSLAHLIELYRYYIRNQQLFGIVTKEIDHYKLINHSSTTHLSISPQNLDLQDFPVLQNALQMQSYDDLCQPITKENVTGQFKVESSLPRDCFQHFIHGDKRKPQSKNSSLRSSMRQDLDKYTQPVVAPKVEPMIKHASQIWSKPSKFKRITIEEALHSNSLLKKVRMQE